MSDVSRRWAKTEIGYVENSPARRPAVPRVSVAGGQVWIDELALPPDHARWFAVRLQEAVLLATCDMTYDDDDDDEETHDG